MEDVFLTECEEDGRCGDDLENIYIENKVEVKQFWEESDKLCEDVCNLLP